MQSSMVLETKDVKLEFLREQIRRTLKQNGLCCCGDEFTCNNCRLIDTLRERADYCCPNCHKVIE